MDIVLTDRRSSDRRRKANRRRQSNIFLMTGPFIIDDERKTAFIDDVRLTLSPKEYALLKLLVINRDRVVTMDEILNALWSQADGASPADGTQYIHLLRKRIKAVGGDPQLIGNVFGFGYRVVTTFD